MMTTFAPDIKHFYAVFAAEIATPPSPAESAGPGQLNRRSHTAGVSFVEREDLCRDRNGEPEGTA